MTFKSELTSEFQEALLQVILQDDSFLLQYRDCLDASYFQNPDLNEIAGIVLQHFDKFGNTMGYKAMAQVLKDGKKEGDLVEVVDTVWNTPILDSSYIKERIIDFAKKRAVTEALFDVEELAKAGQYEEAERMFLAAIHVGDGRPEHKEYFKTLKERVESYRHGDAEKIATGIEFMDEHTSGGASRGEMGIIMSDTGIGKTHILVNIAKGTILGGRKCAYYSLEVATRVIARRMDTSITGLTKQDLKRKPKTTINRLLEASKHITEDAFFIYQHSRLTVSQLEAHLRLLQNKDGFFPDVLIVDYGDLVRADRRYDELRHELSSVFAGLRSIALNHNLVLWTATQSNREGAKLSRSNERVIDKTHSGEDYGKMAIADLVMTANQTLHEKRVGLMRFHWTKIRDDADGATGTVNVDWSRSQITSFTDEEDD